MKFTPTQLNHNASQLLQQERANFLHLHPNSAKLAQESSAHFLYGVPMHWMNDWGTPSPLFVQSAQGAHFTCADGLDYSDFCLGDTGAMFGHSPPAVAAAIASQAHAGYTTMLPSTLAAQVGASLSEHFGLSHWQLATSASDANRFVLRWARAVTGRNKLLVFDGCYHGTVDDTMVDVEGNHTVNRRSLLGQVHDLGLYTQAVAFNDIAAVAETLSSQEFAAVLTEPALTNCGMVLPQNGFIEGVKQLAKQYGTLLILDETHTISTGRGGWAKQQQINPDFLVVGKPIAGGLAAAAYGFNASMASRMQTAKDQATAGHSGIGTTLSGNMLTLAAIQATLGQVATEQAYQHMLNLAQRLEQQLNAALQQQQLAWNITRLGARLELQFCQQTPVNAQQARDAQNDTLESAIHLYLLNRGVLLTPFHNMMLVSPATQIGDIAKLVQVFQECLLELTFHRE